MFILFFWTLTVSFGLYSADVNTTSKIEIYTLTPKLRAGSICYLWRPFSFPAHSLSTMPRKNITRMAEYVNIALIVANSKYTTDSGFSSLRSVEQDTKALKNILSIHETDRTEVKVISDSNNIEKDVLEWVKALPESKKRLVANFHLYYSGHGQYDQYVEAGEPVAKTAGVAQFEPKEKFGDLLIGVNGEITSQDSLVKNVVTHLAKYNSKALFCCFFDKCRNFFKSNIPEMRVQVSRENSTNKLEDALASRVMIVQATLQEQYANGKSSFLQRLVQITMVSPGKVINFCDIEPLLNMTLNQQLCQVVWPMPIVNELNWYQMTWPSSKPLLIVPTVQWWPRQVYNKSLLLSKAKLLLLFMVLLLGAGTGAGVTWWFTGLITHEETPTKPPEDMTVPPVPLTPIETTTQPPSTSRATMTSETQTATAETSTTLTTTTSAPTTSTSLTSSQTSTPVPTTAIYECDIPHMNCSGATKPCIDPPPYHEQCEWCNGNFCEKGKTHILYLLGQTWLPMNEYHFPSSAMGNLFFRKKPI